MSVAAAQPPDPRRAPGDGGAGDGGAGDDGAGDDGAAPVRSARARLSDAPADGAASGHVSGPGETQPDANPPDEAQREVAPRVAVPRAGDARGATADEDDWLVDKARSGDVGAYEVLIRRHHARIHRIALRMLGDPDDAEDVAQEVIIQLWTALAGFAGRAAFTTWLYRVVVNRCLAHRRRARPTRPLTEAHESPAGAGADDVAIARQRTRAVMEAVATLPTNQRSVLVLVDSEGLSYRDAAAVLSVSETAVRSRLARARAAVMTRMRGWS